MEKLSLRERIGATLSAIGTAMKAKPVHPGGNEVGGSKRGSFFGATISGYFLGYERISVDDLFTIWRTHGDVFACIRELSENCGVAGYSWKNAADPEKDPNAASVKAAELVLNSKRTFRRLKSLLVRDVYLAGYALVHVERTAGGKIVGLEEIDPRTMKVVTTKYGDVVKWIQQVGGETVSFEPDEVLSWSLWEDPDSPIFGVSPLETIVWDIRTDLASVIGNYALWQNDSVPAAQYILEEGLDDDEAQRAVDELKKQLKGPENRHKGVVAKGIKEVKTLAITPKDMEGAVLRKMTTEKVCSATGVPKAIIGYTDEVNYANGQEQTQKFWEGTVEPLQEALAEFVNLKLLPAIGITDIKLVYNARKFDNKEWNEASSRADVEHGILTINEARAMRGLTPFDPAETSELVDKPVVWAGLSARPLEDVGVDMIGDDLTDPEQADEAKRFIERFAKRNQHGKPQPKDN